jgi:hypothetical protein
VLLLAELFVLSIGIDDLDEGYFAQQSWRVLHGQLPYRDFSSLYTPGLLYVHAWLFSALGPHLLGPRALSLILRAATAALLYVLARPVVPSAWWAALPGAFVLIGFDDAPGRWEPHPGWPSTAAALLATWCVVRGASRPWLFAAGLAAGAAYTFKQNTGVLMLIALVLHDWRRSLLPLAGFAAACVVWLIPLLLAVSGHYASLGPLIGEVNLAGLISPPEPTILIPIACLLAGVWLIRSPSSTRLRWYMLAGACLFVTEFPRSDSLHLTWSAPLLLVVGTVAASRVRLAVASVAVAVALLLCLPTLYERLQSVSQANTPIIGLPSANGLRVPTQTWSDLVTTVAEIRHRTAPGEPIFVYPSSPLLYLLADRPNATRFDHLNPGAADATDIRGVIDALRDVRLIVVSDFWRAAWGNPGDNAMLEDWIFSEFHEAAHFGQYRVFARDL